MALLKDIKRETIKREWQSISLVFAELIALVLIVFQALQVAGLNINFHVRAVVFKPSYDPVDFVVLAIALVVFALLYLEVKKRQPSLYLAQKMAPGIIKQEAKSKLAKAKEPQAPALLLIEFFFIAAVIIALRAYFDPDMELIPWSRIGIGPPATTALNFVITLAVLAAFYRLYSFTASYRKR